MPTVLISSLFLVLLVALLIIYRGYRLILEKQHTLDCVIRSINPDVLVVLDHDRTITLCNNAVETMFGLKAEEVLGKKTDVFYFDRREGGKAQIAQALDDQGFHIGCATGKRGNAEVFPLEIVSGKLKDRPGAVILLRDITARRQLEEHVIRAKEEAESSNAAKTRALAQLETNYAKLQELERMRDTLTHMIVHDLKSPLSSMIGLLSLVEESVPDELEEDQIKHLRNAKRAGRSLLQMIETLLDIARLESRAMPLNRIPSDLGNLIHEAVTLLDQEGAQKIVGIAEPPTPVIASCDPDIVRRVIANLIINAVKFTPADGEIRIAVQAQGEREIRLAVTDNGKGIPSEYHEAIFERFRQLEVRKLSYGLGLNFCKLAVEAHGGTIHVESQPGKGSTFWFVLPTTPPGAPAALGAA